MKPLKPIHYIRISLLIGFITSLSSFFTFYREVDTRGTEEEWRFYAALTSFIIFFMMFFVAIVTFIMYQFKLFIFNPKWKLKDESCKDNEK